MRLALLGAVLLTASASAQPDSEAERLADSLLVAALEASRAALVGHTSLTASGPEGTIYYRIGEDGSAECRAVPVNASATPFTEGICLLTGTFAWNDDAIDDTEPDVAPDSVWVRSDGWDGADVHVIGMFSADDPDGMERMEVWIERASLVARRILVAGEYEPGLPFDMDLRFDDVRPEAGVLFPRRIVLRMDGLRAMFESMLAEEDIPLREALTVAQARHKAYPTPEGALALRMLKAAVADALYEIAFPITEVRLDAPLPEGLFDDASGL